MLHTQLIKFVNELLASGCLQSAVVICEQWLTFGSAEDAG